MHELKSWIEDHPYLAGGFLIGAFVLYLVFRNSASSASAPATTGGMSAVDYATLQQQQIAAGTQLQAYQIQANAQNDAQTASLNLAAMNNASALQAKYYDAQTQLQQILSNQANTSQSISAGLQLGLAQVLGGGGVEGYQHTTTIYGTTDLHATQVNIAIDQQKAIDAVVTLPPATPVDISYFPPAPATVYTAPPANVYIPPAITYVAPALTFAAPVNVLPANNATAGITFDNSGGDGWFPGVNVPTVTYRDCSTWDTGCTVSNQIENADFRADMGVAQSTNNLDQLIANYQISIDAGRGTPELLAAFHSAQSQVSALTAGHA